jgi:uncharacterized membrane protein
LLVFTLVAILAAQSAVIRPGITASSLRLAASLDRGYGASAVLLLGVGFSRIYWGAKGSSFYLWNPLFWTKIALFAIVAVLSIRRLSSSSDGPSRHIRTLNFCHLTKKFAVFNGGCAQK